MAYAFRKTEKRPVVVGISLALNKDEAKYLLDELASRGGQIAGDIYEALKSALSD